MASRPGRVRDGGLESLEFRLPRPVAQQVLGERPVRLESEPSRSVLTSQSATAVSKVSSSASPDQ